MTRNQIITKVRGLNLPKDSYVVFGNCPLAIAGIREANDIDLLVSKELFVKLKKSGWKEFYKSSNDIPLIHDVFEAHEHWSFSSYNPTLKHLLISSTSIGGIPFASLLEVRKWKTVSKRQKDLADIELIDKFLAKK